MKRLVILPAVLAAALIVGATPSAGDPAGPPVAGPGIPVVPIEQSSGLVSPSGAAMVIPVAEGPEGFFGFMVLAPHAKVPVHRDPTEEYIVVVGGGGWLTLDGTEHFVTDGTAIYMAAKAEVSFQNGPRQTALIQVFAPSKSASKYDKWAPGTEADLKPAAAPEEAPPEPPESAPIGEGIPPIAGVDHTVANLDHEIFWSGPGGISHIKMALGKKAALGASQIEPGESYTIQAGKGQALLMLVGGSESIEIDGKEHPLEGPMSGAYLAAGQTLSITAGQSEAFVFSAVVGKNPGSLFDGWTDPNPFEVWAGSAEANLAGARTAEKAYHAEWDTFVPTPPCPLGTPGPEPREWTGECTASWDQLGWSPDRPVRCTYQARVLAPSDETGNSDFEVSATCDFDGDGNFSRFVGTRSDRASRSTPEDVW